MDKASHDDGIGGMMGFFGCAVVFIINLIGLVIGLLTQDKDTIISSSIFGGFAAIGAILFYCCIGYDGVLFELKYKGKEYSIKE